MVISTRLSEHLRQRAGGGRDNRMSFYFTVGGNKVKNGLVMDEAYQNFMETLDKFFCYIMDENADCSISI